MINDMGECADRSMRVIAIAELLRGPVAGTTAQ
jgi:hypothetical protein